MIIHITISPIFRLTERIFYMFDYTGYTCISCGEAFKSDDDIVVCPDCGTPYHRECYKKEGKCINGELHSSGISWKAEIEAEEAQKAANSAVRCKTCGNELKPEQLFCDHCGAPTDYFIRTKAENGEIPYSQIYGGQASEDPSERNDPNMPQMNSFMVNYTDPLCGFNPAEEYGDGVTVKDLGDFVNTNTHYYLPKFKLIKETNFKISVNFSAMLFPEIYFANRKMPLIALLILIIKAALNFPSIILSLQTPQIMNMIGSYPEFSELFDKIAAYNVNSSAFQAASIITSLASWAMFFIFGLFSNYIYYRHALKKTKQLKANAIASGTDITASLRESGGTSTGMLILFIGLYFVFQYAAIGAVLLIL